jgi:hypothetical protein
MQKTSEILRAGKARIQDPKNWCKGTFMRDSEGRGFADEWRQSPVRWCALGAVMGSLGKGKDYLCRAARSLFISPGISPAYVNDHMGHNCVMMMYDAAIQMAEENER